MLLKKVYVEWQSHNYITVQSMNIIKHMVAEPCLLMLVLFRFKDSEQSFWLLETLETMSVCFPIQWDEFVF